MKAFRSIFSSLFIVVGLAALTPMATAQDLGTVRQQMEQRLPEIDQAKASGHVGENNQGLLTMRQESPEIGKLVAAENADRLTVYAAIARQTGATPAAVAQARARQIASQSAPGIWLQKPDGTWYQK